MYGVTEGVITLAIDRGDRSAHTQRVTVLLICANEERLAQLKDAIHSAGFRLISARALDEAWTKSDFFDFGAVVIDHELQDDIAAPAFRQRFMTLNVEESAAPESVAMQLTNLFHRASELVQ
ncbi:MAG: hypothetical protein DMG61_23245 [Acidobacteria bacterium]|nr:MAG: hypothetical protein DMG61_23245 [Acidobacteriota bacterium]PYY20155.1 MAG: hypothetical protein DMG60_01490 [Acidobacteriota bacterium]